MTRIIATLVCVIPCLSSVMFSCASAPQESVELSTAVGIRITDMQASHEAFVMDYFRLSRDRVEDFLALRFIPQFLETFVRDAGLASALNNIQPFSNEQLVRLREEFGAAGFTGSDLDAALAAVSTSFGDVERGEIVLEFAQAAVTEIEKERKSLLAPLIRLEADVLKDLRVSYAALIAANNTITVFLDSVVKVKAEEDAVLSRLGLLRIRDEALNRTVNISSEITSAIDKGDEAQATIEKLKNLFDEGG